MYGNVQFRLDGDVNGDSGCKFDLYRMEWCMHRQRRLQRNHECSKKRYGDLCRQHLQHNAISRGQRDDQSIIEDGQPRVDNDLYGHAEQRLYGDRRGYLRRVTGKRINSVHLHD